MMKHSDFRKAGMVSIWIGNFGSEIELDDYLNLNRAFEDDFGFDLNERDMPETVVNDSPVSIAELVDGFSWSSSYRSAVVGLAEKQKIREATTMVIFLNFEYRPDRARPKGTAPLRFLGTLRSSGAEH